jgi:Holliday junction DNA helicase RuvA
MIGRLRGAIIHAKPSEIMIDVHGVGYLVSIPFSTFSALAGKTEVDLEIHTYVREDQIRLFGFHRHEEKELFEVLIHISGIGPSIALSVLSGITVEQLYEAVRGGDITRLVKIPGIGKSKAEKLIFELARKLKMKTPSGTATGTHSDDAVEALLSLGYDEKTSRGTVSTICAGNPDLPIEEIIKKSLVLLS